MWLQAPAELHPLTRSFAFEFGGAGFHPEALCWARRRGADLGWTPEEQASGRLLPAMWQPARVSVASRHASVQWAWVQHHGEVAMLCTSEAATWLHGQHRYNQPKTVPQHSSTLSPPLPMLGEQDHLDIRRNESGMSYR